MPASHPRPAAEADAQPFAVSAVVTTFAPTATLLDGVRALLGQVAEVIIVDDGSGAEADAVLDAAAALGARVVRLPENAGIAAALNAGVDVVFADGSDRGADVDGVVFFDQDSHAGAGFVAALTHAHRAASRAGLPVAATAPEFFAGIPQVRGRRAGQLIARQPIQSGLLVGAVALRALGPFREDLFIDLVDTEYTMRAERRGFVIAAAPGLDLPHALGRQVGIAPFGRVVRGRDGRPFGFTVSTPFRYYYRARNRVVVNRAYRRARPFAIARASLLEARHYLIVWLAVQQRREFVALLRAGRRDGRRGRLGRISDAVARDAAGISWRVPL